MRITIDTDQAPNIVHSSDASTTAGAVDAGASGAPRNMTGAASDARGGAAMDAGGPPEELLQQVERARLMETSGGPGADFAGAEDAGAGPRTIQ